VPPPSLPPSLPCAGSCSAAVDKKGWKRNRNEEEGEEDERQDGEERGASESEDAGEDGRNKTGKKKERKGGREGGREGRLEEESEELALLSQAEARLHLSSSPWSTATKAASLPCRERETQEVREGGRERWGGRGRTLRTLICVLPYNLFLTTHAFGHSLFSPPSPPSLPPSSSYR